MRQVVDEYGLLSRTGERYARETMSNQELHDEIKMRRKAYERVYARDAAALVESATQGGKGTKRRRQEPIAVPITPERVVAFAELCRARCALLARRWPANLAVRA